MNNLPNARVSQNGQNGLSISIPFRKNWKMILLGCFFLIFINVWYGMFTNFDRDFNRRRTDFRTQFNSHSHFGNDFFEKKSSSSKIMYKAFTLIYFVISSIGIGLIASSFGKEEIEVASNTIKYKKQIAFIPINKSYRIERNTKFSYNQEAQYAERQYQQSNINNNSFKGLLPFSAKLGKIKLEQGYQDILMGTNLTEREAKTLIQLLNQQLYRGNYN
jgi:hypothetical protein